MFSKKLIVYLKRNSLEIYREGMEGYLARLEFPPDVAKDEEIIDSSKFEELIFTFLNKLSLKENSAQIVLSEEVIFAKTNPLSIEDSEEKQAQQFFEEVPFDPQKIAKRAIKTKNGVNLFAANKNLFLAIISVLSKIQIEAQNVVPATMFGITSTSSALTKNDLKQITSNSDLIKMSNFLEGLESAQSQSSPQPKTQEQKTQEETTSSSSNLLPIIGVVLIILGAAFAIYLYKKPDLKNLNLSIPLLKKQAPTAQISPSPTIDIISSSPEVSQVTKDQLTAKVLNGTGKSGQASLVKNALESLGFSQIQTDNAATQDFQNTTVDFSSKVPTPIRQEIVDNLQKTFSQVKMNVEVSQDFDIIVTTGKQL